MTVPVKQHIPRILSGSIAAALLLWTALSRFAADQVVPSMLASAFLLLICLTDTLHSRIPNVLTLSLAACGLIYHSLQAGFAGFGFALAGLAAGFALLIIPYAMGGMGAGDVKCLAALGALLGPAAIFQVFLYMGLAGGVLSLCHYWLAADLRERLTDWVSKIRQFAYCRDPRIMAAGNSGEKLRFPYAAAIIFGFCAFEQWGRLL